MTYAPARTMQVDWAGTTVRLFDPIDARGAKVSFFVASLPYSGMLFAKPVTTSMVVGAYASV